MKNIFYILLLSSMVAESTIPPYFDRQEFALSSGIATKAFQYLSSSLFLQHLKNEFTTLCSLASTNTHTFLSPEESVCTKKYKHLGIEWLSLARTIRLAGLKTLDLSIQKSYNEGTLPIDTCLYLFNDIFERGRNAVDTQLVERFDELTHRIITCPMFHEYFGTEDPLLILLAQFLCFFDKTITQDWVSELLITLEEQKE